MIAGLNLAEAGSRKLRFAIALALPGKIFGNPRGSMAANGRSRDSLPACCFTAHCARRMKHWLLIFALILQGEGLIAEVRGAPSAAGRRPSEAYAKQTIVISGSVELQDYNPTTGQPHTNQHSRSSFVVMLSGDSWKCSVTNVDWPQWHAEFAYDGT